MENHWAGYKNWDDARAECKRRGGDLATHFTKEDLEVVIPRNTIGYALIGGRMNAQATESNYEDSFEWVNGDRISGIDGLWKRNEPRSLSTKCMAIYRGHMRNDGTSGPAYLTNPCTHLSPFLCKK